MPRTYEWMKELTSEVAFQNAQLFTLALVLFMCAFLFGALALLPGTRWLTWLAWGTSGIGALITGTLAAIIGEPLVAVGCRRSNAVCRREYRL